ncbi:hypothetical protein ACLOJK_028928 [Asimina triloba]
MSEYKKAVVPARETRLKRRAREDRAPSLPFPSHLPTQPLTLPPSSSLIPDHQIYPPASLARSLSQIFVSLAIFCICDTLGGMDAAMDLLRRISPNHAETALSALLTLLPHHSSNLLSQVDQPLQKFEAGRESAILAVMGKLLAKSEFEAERESAIFAVLGKLFSKSEIRSRERICNFSCTGGTTVHLEQILCDMESGKEFILCEYNRDADSYRSPWSNRYHPPLEDGLLPSDELRKLEIEANDIFTIYRDQ